MRRTYACVGLGALALALFALFANPATAQQRVTPPSAAEQQQPVVGIGRVTIPNQVPYVREGWEVPGLQMPHLADALVVAVHQDDDALKFQQGNELGAFHPAPKGGSAFFGAGRAIFGASAPPVLPSRILRPLGSGDAGDRFLGTPPAIQETTVIPKIGDTFDLRRHAYAFLDGVPPLRPDAQAGSTAFPLVSAVAADTNGSLPDNGTPPSTPSGGGGGGGGGSSTTSSSTSTTAAGQPTTTQPGATTTQPGSPTTTQPGATTTTQPGSPTTTTRPGTPTTTTTQPTTTTTTRPGSPSTTTTTPGPPSGTTTTTTPSTTTTTSTTVPSTTTTTQPATTTTTTQPATTTTTAPGTTTTTAPGGGGGNGGNPSTSFVLGRYREDANLCLSSAGSNGFDNANCDRVFDPAVNGNVRPGVAQKVNLTLWNVQPDSDTAAVDLKVFAPTACVGGTTGSPAGSADLCDGLRLRIDRYNSVTERNLGTNGTCLVGCTGSGVTLTSFRTTHPDFASGVSIATNFPVNAKAYLVITALLPDTGFTSQGRGNDNRYLARTATLPLRWQMVSA